MRLELSGDPTRLRQAPAAQQSVRGQCACVVRARADLRDTPRVLQLRWHGGLPAAVLAPAAQPPLRVGRARVVLQRGGGRV